MNVAFGVFIMLNLIPIINTIPYQIWGWGTTNPYILQQYPSPHSSHLQEITNSCGNDTTISTQYGYACPHMMMFSDDMISAMKDEDPRFYFGVAGSNSFDDCGKCYHVEIIDPEFYPLDKNPHVIIQIINNGDDVIPNHLDLYMGGGGFGYYTSCNIDCPTNHCRGGPCKESMYSGNFSDWVNSQYQKKENDRCYDGGVRWLNTSEYILNIMCSNMFKDSDSKEYKNYILGKSCFFSNSKKLHQNFISSKKKRVQCPMNLYKLTGIRRNDDDIYPYPSFDHDILDIECSGDRQDKKFCITNMQDCCRPACSWSSQNTDTDWPSTYTCNRDGIPIF